MNRKKKKTKAKSTSSSKIRLNKYLADHGVASRRKADEMIEDGKVQLNGKKVYELGVKVDPETDSIKVNGKLVRSKPMAVYFAFNKPKQVVTTNSDPEGRPTVMDYFRKQKIRLFPVGRLDWDTEGLLLVTNDGDFANRISHPTSKVPKTYQAKLDGIPTKAKLDKLKTGVSIVGGRVKALDIKRLSKGTDKKAWVQITITEGKNRQIRKMFEKIGFDVVKLKRIAIGGLKLSGLRSGEFKALTVKDKDRIFSKPRPASKKRLRPKSKKIL